MGLSCTQQEVLHPAGLGVARPARLQPSENLMHYSQEKKTSEMARGMPERCSIPQEVKDFVRLDRQELGSFENMMLRLYTPANKMISILEGVALLPKGDVSKALPVIGYYPVSSHIYTAQF